MDWSPQDFKDWSSEDLKTAYEVVRETTERLEQERDRLYDQIGLNLQMKSDLLSELISRGEV